MHREYILFSLPSQTEKIIQIRLYTRGTCHMNYTDILSIWTDLAVSQYLDKKKCPSMLTQDSFPLTNNFAITTVTPNPTDMIEATEMAMNCWQQSYMFSEI